jgi:inner membrane protein
MNAGAHRLIGAAAMAMAVASATLSPRQEETAAHAVAGCAGGYCFGTLPDLIEPATSPHHRQFFHSLIFAGVMGYGLYRLYQWEPGSPEFKVIRMIGLIAGGAYLVHLALDATTKRSLPLLGRLR